MKRIIGILLLLLILSGCTAIQNRAAEPVNFYYLQQHSEPDGYDRFFSDGVIGAEEREISGHRDDLNYMLSLYMQGPTDSSLRFPFPVGSKILETHVEDGKVTIIMNSAPARFDEMNVTLSCACIAKTCMQLADVTEVTVESHGSDDQVLFSRTFTSENLILEDACTLPPETTEDS